MKEQKTDRNMREKLPEEIIRAAVTLLVVAGLAVPAVLLKLPMLAVLPLTGTVAATAFFGCASGAVGAVVTAVCGAYTLSEGNGFVSYSAEGVYGLVALIFAAVICVLFVNRMRKLNREYSEESAALRARLEADSAAAPEKPADDDASAPRP